MAKKYKDAVLLLKEGASIYPKNSKLHTNLGLAYEGAR